MEMDMAVEWFNAKLGAPMVSIGPNGMTFTPAARALIGDPRYVKVGVNVATRKVCVQETDQGDDCAMEFAARKDKNGYVRLAQRDIARFILSKLESLTLEGTRKCVASWNRDMGILEVCLETPARPARQGRRGSQAREA